MKRILFIGLPYHSYTYEIIKSLELKGYIVKYYPIKPRKVIHKIIQTISKSIFQYFLNNYHKGIIDAEKERKYDIILFLQIHYVSFANMNLFKSRFPNSKFILYNWDSINTHDYRSYLNYFDSVFTFDKTDADALKIKYLPLFALGMFEHMKKTNNKKIDVYFVGNIVNVNRYSALMKFKKYCKLKKIKFSYYAKFTPVTFIKCIINGHLPLDAKFTNISKSKFYELAENSKAVFDFANHQQNGYTMRFIENLCAQKKIITNMKMAKEDYFYSEERIFIFDNLDFVGIDGFLQKPICTNETFEEFRLNNFTSKLIDC